MAAGAKLNGERCPAYVNMVLCVYGEDCTCTHGVFKRLEGSFGVCRVCIAVVGHYK